MQSIHKQIRYVSRKLARSPLFTTIAVLTLAIGIGANTAIFSVVNGVLLKPLPFEDPESLVGAWHTAPGLGFDQVNQSPATYFTYREESQTFEDIGMWDNTQVSVTGLEEPEQVTALMVTDGTFPLLKMQPMLGRNFSAEDDSPSSPETVILSHGYWQRRFSGDRDVMGRMLTVNGRPREIIGVMPSGFRFLRYDPALFLPFRLDRSEVYVGDFSYQGLARLKPGVSIEQANADVARMFPLVFEKFQGGLEEVRQAVWSFNSNLPLANVQTLEEILEDSMARTSFTMIMLGIASGVALLLGVVGIYGVISYAVSQRTREIGIRMAIGAQQGDVSRLFVRHGLLLTAVGVVVGIAAALGLTRLMSALLFGVNPLDPVTYAAVAVTLASIAFLASYVPARRASSVDPVEALRWE